MHKRPQGACLTAAGSLSFYILYHVLISYQHASLEQFPPSHVQRHFRLCCVLLLNYLCICMAIQSSSMHASLHKQACRASASKASRL